MIFRETREALGVSVDYVARMTGLPVEAILRIESGQEPIPEDVKSRMAYIKGVLDDLKVRRTASPGE